MLLFDQIVVFTVEMTPLYHKIIKLTAYLRTNVDAYKDERHASLAENTYPKISGSPPLAGWLQRVTNFVSRC